MKNISNLVTGIIFGLLVGIGLSYQIARPAPKPAEVWTQDRHGVLKPMEEKKK